MEAHVRGSQPRWLRRLVVAAGILFAGSTMFPIVASLIPIERHPAWAGPVDVALACALVACAAVIDRAAGPHAGPESEHVTYRLYRGLHSAPLVLLLVFFLVGTRGNWSVLLAGLAWRAWLISYVLPKAVAVMRPSLA
jgi:hypothetical protein